MDALRLIIIFGFCTWTSYGISVQILKPINTTGSDAALVVVPGAKISGSGYQSLAVAIQKSSGLTLWVALLDGFLNKLPNMLQFPSAFKKAVKELNNAGYNGKVFLAGHSLGGTISADYGLKKNSLLEGVLLFSSYVSREHALNKYPFPVLTISGDLDGLCRITRIVDIFEELLKDVKEDSDQKYKTPVIVIEGVNHALFATGPMPSAVRENDLNAEVNESYAHDTIAAYSNAFMLLVRDDVNTSLTEARSVLDDGFKTTASIMEPLSIMKQLDQNTEMVSHWTNTAQQFIVSLKNTTSVEFLNHEEDEFRSKRQLHKKSGVKNLSDTIIINSTTIISFARNPTDSTFEPLSPLQLKATMKSQKAVKQILPDAPFGTPASCKDINEAAYTLAYSESSSTAKARSSSRGRRIGFIDDVNTTSLLQWQRAFLQLNYNRTGLFVKSTRYTTSHSDPESGQDDCTLLSPYRAMEWIYLDSLKYTIP